MVDQAYINRIKEKTIENQLLNELREGYGYPPTIARSIVTTVQDVLSSPLSQEARIGTLSYLATPSSSGASVKLKDVPFKRVRLTLQADGDPEFLRNHGVGALRRAKILRMTEEAYEQDALLTIEDLATLLCSSVRTIEYDLQYLREQGLAVRTRGQVKGIGLRVSHKAWIVGLYLDGCEMDDLVMKTKHSEQSIENYIERFRRVVILTENQMNEDEIASSLGVSRVLVREYQRLMTEHHGSKRLEAIWTMGIPDESKKTEGTG